MAGTYTLRQLEYFVAVAEAGSVTAAAQQIHLSQSALSTALAELERALDVQLLLRHHARGVSLTPAGEQLLTGSRRLLREAAELADEARGLGKDVTGTFHLACFGVLAPYVLPEVLAAVAARLPMLEVTTSEVDLAELVEGIGNGRFELAIGYDLTSDPRLETTRLYSLRPYVLLPRTHRLAGRKRIKLADLADDPLALLDLPYSREYFAGLFQAVGLHPTIRYRSTSTETCRALVARGLAYTVLNARPRDDGSLDHQAVVPVAISHEAASLDVVLIKAAGVRPTRRMSAVREIVDDLVATGSIASMFGDN
ncbi:LysR family transcriptional regulator [Nocardioides carbamazepini]|uniref:LysR family transcriptional regulator n=1 Tax=Nocardioides carbamazepini TaxID=2854259 RepID=UPI00214A6A19|nr:LysR family transcriptional regulator [Nocardioides carbamazepini]MCR1786143.1 LysR family transcriptional regulator [Nocardioides carbamazepini]